MSSALPWQDGSHMMTVAPAVAAVDGKTSKHNDDDGDPIHVLNVFAHEAKVLPTGRMGTVKIPNPRFSKHTWTSCSRPGRRCVY
ncbi:MAG: hypothetical protein U0792_07345 [Gemmataceae bacterium]